jgi:hypothetical protein
VQAWGITNELALNEQSRVVISIWRWMGTVQEDEGPCVFTF